MFNCIADFEDGNMRDIEQNREHYVRLVRESEDASITGSWGSNQDFRYRMLADKNIFLGGGGGSIPYWKLDVAQAVF